MCGWVCICPHRDSSIVDPLSEYILFFDPSCVSVWFSVQNCWRVLRDLDDIQLYDNWVIWCARIASTASSMRTMTVGLFPEVKMGLHGSGGLSGRNGKQSFWMYRNVCQGTAAYYCLLSPYMCWYAASGLIITGFIVHYRICLNLTFSQIISIINKHTGRLFCLSSCAHQLFCFP